MEESAFAVGWLCSASMRRADCVRRIRDDRYISVSEDTLQEGHFTRFFLDIIAV